MHPARVDESGGSDGTRGLDGPAGRAGFLVGVLKAQRAIRRRDRRQPKERGGGVLVGRVDLEGDTNPDPGARALLG